MKKITLSFLLIFSVIIVIVFVIPQKTPIEKLSVSETETNTNTEKTTPVINTEIPKETNQNKDIPTTPIEIQLKSPNINITNLKNKLSQTDPGSYNTNTVSKHNSESDCYLIINNNVYDVSSYIGNHPGGKKNITSRCGTEVSGIFAKIHSNRAWDLLKKYKIGALSSTTPINPTEQIVSAIFDALQKSNPTAEIVKVSPKNNFYIAKVIANNSLYEVHIDNSGKITSQEKEIDELDWANWENDTDDR